MLRPCDSHDTAGLVADLPSKQGIREAVLGAAQATVELLLAEHKREEQGRWEVRAAVEEAVQGWACWAVTVTLTGAMQAKD